MALTGDRASQRRFLTSQLVFGVLLSVASVIIFFAGGAFFTGGLGPFAYRNQFAAYIESVLGVAIAFAINDRRRRAMWTLIAAALFASVVAGGSRAGSILCLAELIVIPMVAFARGWLPGKALLRVGMLAAVAGGVLVAVVGWTRIIERFEEPHPYSLRADLLRSSVAMARDRPLSGFGLGAWSTAYPAYARFDDGDFVNQAHNDWAQWAAEGGLPMLAIMAAVLALLARPAIDTLWGLGLIAVFVHAGVDYPFQQRPALAAFFFAMAGALAAERRVRAALATSSPAAGPPRAPSPVPAPSGSSPPEG
jgi:O-antigen ligase